MMTGYKGTFLKKDGERRTMRFVRVGDLPKKFLSENTKGGKHQELRDGMELVWDIDAKDFRIFNHNMRVDNLEEFEYTLQ